MNANLTMWTLIVGISCESVLITSTVSSNGRTSIGSFFVRKMYIVISGDLCVDQIELSVEKERKKSCFFGFIKWNTRWDWYLSMRRQSIYLCSAIKMFFRIVSKAQFWKKRRRLYITWWIWKINKVSIKSWKLSKIG